MLKSFSHASCIQSGLAKNSSGLGPIRTLGGVLARDPTGDLRGKETVVRLPEVTERW